MSQKFDQGMKTRREVLGDAHVDRAEAAKTEFDLPFQSLITESAWGTVWSSDKISRRERSMLLRSTPRLPKTSIRPTTP